MKIIKLRPVNISGKIIDRLERRGLIRALKPTPKILKLRSPKGAADAVYTSAPKSGSHMLLCIRQDDASRIALNSHSDNEEFILINSASLKFKPLYMVVGLHKYKELESRARNKKLSGNDFLVLRLRYNDPKTSIFTMLKDTPHCQITFGGKGRPPIFFVTEPSALDTAYLKLSGYDLILGR